MSLSIVINVVRRQYRSLFGRLLGIFIVAALLIVGNVVFTMNKIVEDHPRNQMSQRLVSYVFTRLGIPPDPAALAALSADLGWGIGVMGPGFSWRSAPDLPGIETLERLAPPGPTGLFWVDGQRWAVQRQGHWRYYVTGFKLAWSDRFRRAVLEGAAALGVVLLGTYGAVRWLFTPIRQVRAGADRIAGGELHHRITTNRVDELGELTGSVNAMANRLQAGLDAKRHLLLAMGHELRTPLTRARLLAEMLPPTEDRGRLIRNLDEMGDLTRALLEAETLADPHFVLSRAPCDLAGLVREAMAAAEGAAEGARVRVDLPTPPLPPVPADRLRLRLVLGNLLGNAVRHGGGVVRVALYREGTWALICIADHGPGIAPAHLAQLGQAFWRPDPARSRKTGGHGLGLYLCRAILASHGGGLAIASTQGVGTTVTVRLPVDEGPIDEGPIGAG